MSPRQPEKALFIGGLHYFRCRTGGRCAMAPNGYRSHKQRVKYTDLLSPKRSWWDLILDSHRVQPHAACNATGGPNRHIVYPVEDKKAVLSSRERRSDCRCSFCIAINFLITPCKKRSSINLEIHSSCTQFGAARTVRFRPLASVL